MKKLFLLRHGEAGFGEDTDFKRRLTSRGKSAVSKLAKTVQKTQDSIDFMYCSPASRTIETAEIFGNEVLIRASKHDEKIYSGDVNHLILLLESLPDSVESCLIVGHNPTISLLLSLLSDGSYINLQPGNLGIIEFEFGTWKMISRGAGNLVEIIS